jgi:hypothetical protein
MDLVYFILQSTPIQTHNSDPRLLQLDSRDPFFRPKVFNVNLVKQAATSKESFKCASWNSLYSMMIRVDNQEDFTKEKDTHPGFQSAI